MLDTKSPGALCRAARDLACRGKSVPRLAAEIAAAKNEHDRQSGSPPFGWNAEAVLALALVNGLHELADRYAVELAAMRP